MELTPNLVPLQALIGTWFGEGLGEYPTIDPFRYREEVTFAFVGKPFLAYSQRTWSPEGTPLHVETGYLRHTGGGHLEFVLALPTGQVELGEGDLVSTDGGLDLSLDARCWSTSTAKNVTATRRTYRLRGDELRTDLNMEAVGQPTGRHLASVLRRTD